MDSLSDKLKALGVQVGTSHIPEPTKKAAATLSLIDVLPGSWETNPLGDCFTVRKRFPLSGKHGRYKMSPAPDLSFFEAIPNLEGISKIPPEDFLFIDTETTGLSGGAGTYVFLIGVAKYNRDELDFAQFFLQDPANESAQLAALEQFISSSKIIVSYNGKSFDLPRINTRYRFHGLPTPFSDIYHLDLLHFARRLWKVHLPGCTLGDLEYHLLELEREGLDIPGWKVAEHFIQYLSTGDPVPLKNIFYHNEVDVISLASLLGYLNDRLSSPLQSKFRGNPDLISIGAYLYSLRLFQEAQEVLTEALSNSGLSSPLELKGKLCLASIHKKAGEPASAVPLWKECTEMGSLEAHLELAKFAEHTQRDIQEAIHWTLSAIDLMGTLPSTKQAILSPQLDHRLRRLKRKAKR